MNSDFDCYCDDDEIGQDTRLPTSSRAHSKVSTLIHCPLHFPELLSTLSIGGGERRVMISAYNSYNEPYQIICIPASTLLPAHSPHLPLKVSYFTTSRFDIFARQSKPCSEWRPPSSSERRTREATWSSLWSAARWVFHSLISAI